MRRRRPRPRRLRGVCFGGGAGAIAATTRSSMGSGLGVALVVRPPARASTHVRCARVSSVTGPSPSRRSTCAAARGRPARSGRGARGATIASGAPPTPAPSGRASLLARRRAMFDASLRERSRPSSHAFASSRSFGSFSSSTLLRSHRDDRNRSATHRRSRTRACARRRRPARWRRTARPSRPRPRARRCARARVTRRGGRARRGRARVADSLPAALAVASAAVAGPSATSFTSSAPGGALRSAPARSVHLLATAREARRPRTHAGRAREGGRTRRRTPAAACIATSAPTGSRPAASEACLDRVERRSRARARSRGPVAPPSGGRERDSSGDELPAERGHAQRPLDRLRRRGRLERRVGERDASARRPRLRRRRRRA